MMCGNYDVPVVEVKLYLNSQRKWIVKRITVGMDEDLNKKKEHYICNCEYIMLKEIEKSYFLNMKIISYAEYRTKFAKFYA